MKNKKSVLFIIFLFLVTGVLGSCGTPRKEKTKGSHASHPPFVLAHPYGPDDGSSGNLTGSSEVGLEAGVGQKKYDHISLILGPGLTRGYACSGLFKELEEEKIEIQSVLAGEICALVAALYSTQPTSNRVDWLLMQIKEEMLFKKSGLFSSAPEKKLEKKLEEFFGNKKLEELNPPLTIPLLNVKTQTIHFFNQGKLSEILRATLSTQGGLGPALIHGEEYSSAAYLSSYPLPEKWMNPQGERDELIYLFEIKKADLLLRKTLEQLGIHILSVPLSGIQDRDFKKRNEAIFLGRKAFVQAKDQVLQEMGRENK